MSTSATAAQSSTTDGLSTAPRMSPETSSTQEFNDDVKWRSYFNTSDMGADGAFSVRDGKGVLESFANDDSYLKSPIIPFIPGMTAGTQVRRSADNGQFTEFEMGVDGVGFVWHYQWSTVGIWMLKVTRPEGQVPRIEQVEYQPFKTLNPTIQMWVTTEAEALRYEVLDVTNNVVVMSGKTTIDLNVDSTQKMGSHINFVTTGNAATTRANPVAQSIDWFYASTLPNQGIFNTLWTASTPAPTQSGIQKMAGGSGLAPGYTVRAVVNFDRPFATIPTLTLTPQGNHENGGDGRAEAWVYNVTTTGAELRVRNSSDLIQTVDVHWTARTNT